MLALEADHCRVEVEKACSLTLVLLLVEKSMDFIELHSFLFSQNPCKVSVMLASFCHLGNYGRQIFRNLF